ncbi:Pyruvate kinase PKLR [Thelohanellus kitauei]|uniref:Pyruvate kinase n=1 Tax=Thelohanellus kitauei TaxID=669202 RepID=A0A0C2NHY5_THEKT|nr:Pyruvate kinase PKLR [Thelohanellus kitauei]
MIREGMCVACFNLSKGTQLEHRSRLDLVRTLGSKFGENSSLAFAIDINGSEIRTGTNLNQLDINLIEGQGIIITTDSGFKGECTSEKLYIDYKNLIDSINSGQIILIDNGLVVLEVKQLRRDDVVCRVIKGSTLGSQRNVILPGVKNLLPVLTAKDRNDIIFAINEKVDILFIPNFRDIGDVSDLRELIQATDHGRKMKIIYKVSDHVGVTKINELIEVSDGVLIDRTSLTLDIGPERTNIAQKMIISLCNLAGKPVICGGRVLESVNVTGETTSPETSDVINAIWEGVDGLMLFEKTANGKDPVNAVKMLNSICLAAEKTHRTRRHLEAIKNSLRCATEEQAIAIAAVEISYSLKTDAIIVLTTTGRTAEMVSMFRPRCYILAVTRTPEVARWLHLYRSVCPVLYTKGRIEPWVDDVEARIKFAVHYGTKHGSLHIGSNVVLITGWKSGAGSTNYIRVAYVNKYFSIDGF